MSKDPVCGKEVQETREALKASKDGVVYYFCCVACQAKFKRDPTRYVEPGR
jgi:Cu+-exporting ATPase